MEIEKKIIELEKAINKPILDICINMDFDTAVKLFKLSKHMSEDEYWCFLEGSLKSAIYDKFAELFKEEEHMIEGRLGCTTLIIKDMASLTAILGKIKA